MRSRIHLVCARVWVNVKFPLKSTSSKFKADMLEKRITKQSIIPRDLAMVRFLLGKFNEAQEWLAESRADRVLGEARRQNMNQATWISTDASKGEKAMDFIMRNP